jgi:predicted transcriptional regulator
MAEPDFARNLNRLIAERGMTPAQFRERSGINGTTVYEYLNGTHVPSYAMLRRIRAAIGCTWDELLGE